MKKLVNKIAHRSKHHWKELHGVFGELRESDDHTKRRWLIGLSVASSVLVIMLWIGYIQIIIKPVDPPLTAEQAKLLATAEKIETEEGLGLISALGNGIGVVTKKTASGGNQFLGMIMGLFGKKHAIEIENENAEKEMKKQTEDEVHEGFIIRRIE
ncbi:MAG: hypothetical protein COU08_00850 [Candidatus Harrisonbacteria bacterium CG10_big_fil_rev_8_21_14_0_10_42_17]|uniref:Uncharacterized protein n=1 Tax=Candidatus Harrisonbacteria bacterium CG10_big_fil_rev_8_21_14_0_10_42_17 TaxID=1974584 RepID=A0A2M6WIU8_9BACT|nr:MAG: hypothetical protein COU08_00850 [Candidatus Harrisonbacteria bacterium CG10_big_fil_rev_8_21_14_0_10_42_17]